MRSGDFDLGFCFDGDGDRMDLMFPDGTQIIPGLNMFPGRAADISSTFGQKKNLKDTTSFQ